MVMETLEYENIGPALVTVLAQVYGNKRRASLALGIDRAQLTRWKQGKQRPTIEVLRKVHRGCPECRPLIDGLFQIGA